jgi:hypothetical protein
MTGRLARALLAGTAALALCAPGAAAQELDEEIACVAAVPDAASVGGVTDDGGRVSLDVAVLLDGVTLARGQEVLARAADAYAPLGVDLTPTGFTEVALDGTDASGLIEQSRAHFGGERPAGADLVYTLTAKDIELEGNTGVAGLADCIGGVRYPHRAFAVGEQFEFENLAFGPFTFYKDATAKIAGAELGHLMGAHHHYANCAEGIEGESTVSEASPCSLMANFVDFIALKFGTLESAVVRGHALEFAAP